MAKKIKRKCKRRECYNMFYPEWNASAYCCDICRTIGRKEKKIARAIKKKKEEERQIREKLKEELKREALNEKI